MFSIPMVGNHPYLERGRKQAVVLVDSCFFEFVGNHPYLERGRKLIFLVSFTLIFGVGNHLYLERGRKLVFKISFSI